jgi:hypothetical protein
MSSLSGRRLRVLLAFVLWLSPAIVSGETVTVFWDPSAGATGYTVRWGTAPGSYPNSADAGTSVAFAIGNLTEGTTYWAVVQAYNTAGASAFSTPVQFTIPSTPVPCTYAISPDSISVPAASASGTILVTTQTGCAWTATSNSSFVAFQNGTGRTGSGSVGFTVSANTTTSLRTAITTVAGKTFSVSQAGMQAPCTYSISPASASIAAAATTGTILVTTQSHCDWTATSSSGFITFQNGTGRTGPGTVVYDIAANTSSFRSGTATVAGKTFTVWQGAPAATPSCTYSINPGSLNISAAAVSGTIVITTQTGCSWNATSTSGFISFQNGTARSGPGSVGYTISANTSSSARTGIAAVAARTFLVSQAGATAGTPGSGSSSSWSSDFDGDGRNDLLVHDPVGGSVEAWFLDGAIIKGTRPLSDRMDGNWMLVGRGDFNADAKPDLVWQHSTEGWVELWYMEGTVRTGVTRPSIDRIDDPLWRIAGVGDFNSDGKPDLAWQHTGNGALAVWQMNGAAVTATLSVIPDRTPDLLWKVVGVADFNGDGRSDLLWRHQGTGEVGAWLMNGVSRIIYSPLNPFAVTDQNWQIAAVIDANGDGKADLIWEHANGSILIWHMNGTSRLSSASVAGGVPVGWHIVGPK